MSFNPFPQAAPDFSDPLGLLRACHERIFGHCTTLERLRTHLEKNGADDEARTAMARIHRYFSTAARHHHEDEEQSLFPLLRLRDAGFHSLINALEAEHARLTDHWQHLEPFLLEPDRAVAEAARFATAVTDFVAGYRAHAQKENTELLPRAASALGAADLETIGNAMAARRR